MDDTLRKRLIIAEILAIVQKISSAIDWTLSICDGGESIGEQLALLPLPDLVVLKRELWDLIRSMEGL